jgi:hypothetical protein
MTLEAIEKRIAQLNGYESDGHFSTAERAERDRLVEERDRFVRRAPIEAALMPTQNIARAFIRTLAMHAIDLAVEHKITVDDDYYGQGGGVKFGGLAHIDRRHVIVPPVLTETAYAICLHEYAHVICAWADSRQQRHWIEGDFLNSPGAESDAWTYAHVRLCYRDSREPDRPIWTAEMHEKLSASLEGFKPRANADERETLSKAIGASYGAVVAAPDTREGREHIVDLIQMQDRPRLRRALTRLSSVAW